MYDAFSGRKLSELPVKIRPNVLTEPDKYFRLLMLAHPCFPHQNFPHLLMIANTTSLIILAVAYIVQVLHLPVPHLIQL